MAIVTGLAVDVRIPPHQLKRLADDLNPKQYRGATFQVVKKTNEAVARLVAAEVLKLTLIKKKYITKKVVVTIPPKGDPPEGKVVVKDQPIPLVAFPHKAPPKRKKRPPVKGKKQRKRRQPKQVGVTVQETRGRAPLHLRHAFKATMKSGHTGIFVRGRAFGPKGWNIFTKSGRRRKWRAITEKGFASRLPIDELRGRSVYNVVNIPDVLKSIVFDAGKEMDKQVQSQLDRFLKPRR